MSARAIVSGALHKAAEERISKAGKQFATLTLRENVNGSTRWWKAIAFDEGAIAVLKELSAGAPIAVAGEIDAEIWTPEDGSSPRVSWKLTVDAVLSARRRGERRADV
jgi:single-stranded DNA-binding protein